MTDAGDREREEIELILPWYEKGTLSKIETHRVERYLETHPELHAQLALIREELEETIAANEDAGMPAPSGRDRLMAQIAAKAEATQPVSASLRETLLRWLPYNFKPGLVLAAGLAALIIIVQAVALISLISAESNSGAYRVASGQQAQPGTGTFVLVRFAENATAGQISELLKSIGGTIVDGPKPGGVFRVRISPQALSATQRDAVLRTLLQKTEIVTFAVPAG